MLARGETNVKGSSTQPCTKLTVPSTYSYITQIHKPYNIRVYETEADCDNNDALTEYRHDDPTGSCDAIGGTAKWYKVVKET